MDFSSICHVCFESKTSLIDTEKDILVAIKEIFRIKFSNKRETNPFQICDSCLEKLKEFYAFFTKTRDNLRKYESFLHTKSEQLVKKEEITTENEYEAGSPMHINDKLVVEINDLKEIKQESPLFSCHFDDNRSDYDESDKEKDTGDETKDEHNKCRCGRTYKSRISFLQHQRKNLPECNHNSEHTCSICLRKYYSLKTLNQHVKKSHAPTTVKRYLFPGTWTCDICSRTFETRNGIKKHIEEKHLKIHETLCSHCGISINFYDLSKHMNLKHNKDRKRDKCEICNKFFLDLKAHNKRNHLNEGCFTCAVCGLTFNNRLKLSVHNWRKHPPPGKFKCKECGKECSNSLKLKEHMQAAHIGGFLYSCEWCDYRGNHKKNIQTHWKKYHNDLYEAKKAKMRAVYDTPNA